MLTFTAFIVLMAALITGVWWATRDDQGAS